MTYVPRAVPRKAKLTEPEVCAIILTDVIRLDCNDFEPDHRLAPYRLLGTIFDDRRLT